MFKVFGISAAVLKGDLLLKHLSSLLYKPRLLRSDELQWPVWTL